MVQSIILFTLRFISVWWESYRSLPSFVHCSWQTFQHAAQVMTSLSSGAVRQVQSVSSGANQKNAWTETCSRYCKGNAWREISVGTWSSDFDVLNFYRMETAVADSRLEMFAFAFVVFDLDFQCKQMLFLPVSGPHVRRLTKELDWVRFG